jgi:acyl carrier protein
VNGHDSPGLDAEDHGIYPLEGPRREPSIGAGMDTQIRVEITEFIVANYLFGDVTRTPRDEDLLVEEGIIDSTGILELIEFLEDRFGIEVSEAETVPQNLGTISSLTQFVMHKSSIHEPDIQVPEAR